MSDHYEEYIEYGIIGCGKIEIGISHVPFYLYDHKQFEQNLEVDFLNGLTLVIKKMDV